MQASTVKLNQREGGMPVQHRGRVAPLHYHLLHQVRTYVTIQECIHTLGAQALAKSLVVQSVRTCILRCSQFERTSSDFVRTVTHFVWLYFLNAD